MTMTSELRDQALGVAGALDPDVMTGSQAAAAVNDLATVVNAVGGTLMFLALRVARSDEWKGQGHATAADWLAWKVGISVAEASRQLGTANKAKDLPKTKDQIKKGKLSTDQAGAVADGAAADPDSEDSLLDSAEHDTNKTLKDKAAKARAAATDSAERERRIRRNRSLRRGTDADGAFWLRLYGPGMSAAVFDAMLKPFEELMFRHGRSTGNHDTCENRSHDALLAMLAYFHNGGASGPAATESNPDADAQDDHADADDNPEACDDHDNPEPSGDSLDDQPSGEDEHSDMAAPDDQHPHDGSPPASSSPAAPPPSSGSPPAASPAGNSPPVWRPPWDPERAVALPAKLPGGNNMKVIVNVDHSALLRGYTIAGETSEIAGVGPISIAAVKDILANDPFLAVVIRKGRDVVNVAHHGRGLNAHQRTAIEATGLACTNIACNRTIALQMDHRIGYAEDPITKLDNHDPLCPTCHPQKTNHGWHLEHGTSRRRFLPPDHPDNPLTPSGETTPPSAAGDPTEQASSQPRRQLDPTDPTDQLEARIRARLASHGRVVQPTLC